MMGNRGLLFYLGIGIMIIPYIVWFILGEDSFVLIHDNLDSEFVYIKLLLQSGDLFGLHSSTQVTSVMNGVDRSFFRSGINLTFLIFSVLPPIIAYIFHHMLVHMIGYVGMYILIKNYLIKENDLLVMLISLCFGFLSYYHMQYGISISGQPLLLFAFLNLLMGDNKFYNWIIIVAFPFFSFLPVTLPFFLPIITVIGIIRFYQTRVIPMSFILGIFMIFFINVLLEYNLIYATLFSDNLSHRTTWERILIAGEPSFDYFISRIIDSLHTHYHAGRMSVEPVLYSLGIAVLFRIKVSKLIKGLMGLILLISIWVALNTTIIFYLGDYFGILKIFQFDRFLFMLPFLWLLLLAAVLKEFNWDVVLQKYIAILLVLITANSIINNNKEYKKNIEIIISGTISEPTFAQFYDQDLFGKIRAYIGADNLNKYNILNIGIFPNIAQYNGFKTLDSYQNNYSLTYKNEFRKIIEGELDKDTVIQKYFDYWGSRCYSFTSTLGIKHMYGKNSKAEIDKLDFDFDQFKKMEGKYFLSAVPINDSNLISLNFLKSFTTEKSFWKLYLYEVYSAEKSN